MEYNTNVFAYGIVVVRAQDLLAGCGNMSKRMVMKVNIPALTSIYIYIYVIIIVRHFLTASISRLLEELFLEKGNEVRFQVTMIKYTQQREDVKGVTTLISETSIPAPIPEGETVEGQPQIKRQRSTRLADDYQSNVFKVFICIVCAVYAVVLIKCIA